MCNIPFRTAMKPLVPLISICSVLLMACPQRTAVWIVRGSTISHLEFGISDRRNGTEAVFFGGFRISSCGSESQSGESVWLIEADSLNEIPPTRLVYGIVPLGFHNLKGPEPLKSGCYSVGMSGTGNLRFVIRPDGSVHQLAGIATSEATSEHYRS